MKHDFAPHVRRSLDGDARYEKSTLSNGMRVVTEHVPGIQSLAIGVWIDTGSRDERPAEAGMAHFMEHMVFKGTAHRKPHHIAQYLEAVGGYLNAWTTKDNTCYYARVLEPHLSRALHLLADLVQHATLPEREIEKEKGVIIEEMRGADDDPEDAIHDSFEAMLYGRHPLAHPVIGHEHSVRTFRRDSLQDFVGRHYVAENILVTAAGAVDHDVLCALCEKEFAALPRGARVRRRPPRSTRGGFRVEPRHVQQSHLVLGVAAEGMRTDRTLRLQVFSTLLGEGMSSRLFQRIRERHGYAYNIYSFSAMYADVSTLGVYAGVERGREERTRQLVLRELQELAARPVSVRELNRALEQSTGSMLLGLESMSSRMSRLGRDELVFGRDVPVRELLGSMRELTPEDMRMEAERLLQGDGPACVMFVPHAP